MPEPIKTIDFELGYLFRRLGNGVDRPWDFIHIAQRLLFLDMNDFWFSHVPHPPTRVQHEVLLHLLQSYHLTLVINSGVLHRYAVATTR